MVKADVYGLQQIKAHFGGLEDSYAIIGGTACQIVLAQQDFQFRATRDIDLVLIVDSKFDEITKAVWRLIKDGEYKCGWKNSSEPHFYRFTEPQVSGFPAMIELFSSYKTDLESFDKQTIIPIHTSDDLSSLSAILLNEEYYDFLNSGKTTISGITVIDQYRLIPFKAKAYVDLLNKKANGTHVNSKDLVKHKKDIFRLAQIIETDIVIDVCDEIKNDLKQFVELVKDENLPLEQMGVVIDKHMAIDLLNKTYKLK